MGGLLGTLLSIGLIALALNYRYYKSKEPKKLGPNMVLRIQLDGQLVEEVINNTSSILSLDKKTNQQLNLLTIKKVLLAAQQDDRIKGLYLSVRNLSAGWVLLEGLREALLAFKNSGKFIISYAESYTPAGYYLASLSDEIILHPDGYFVFKGFSIALRFYKGLFDKLEIQPEVFRVGRYKSFVETFTRSNMSEDNKKQFQVLLDAMYDRFMQGISSSRNIPIPHLVKLADTISVTTPTEAKEAHLITHVAHMDEVERWLRAKLVLTESQSIPYIDDYAYCQHLCTTQGKGKLKKQPKIAVILATGSIVNTSQTKQDELKASRLVKILKKLRKHDEIKAIVLRINSPGGSSLASGTLWKELVLTKSVKPIVASMSNVAASGGYLSAVACNYIIAHPATITGSIGIFAIYFDIHKALKNKLGITLESVKTNPSADIFDFTRPFTEGERKVIQKNVNQGYEAFLNQVAAGRHMTVSEVDRLAQGRVWPGNLAKSQGLVDELGDLELAIQKAASLAELKEGTYEVTYVSQHKPNWRDLLVAQLSLAKQAISNQPSWQGYVQELQSLVTMQGMQARWPYAVEVQ